MCMFLPMTLMFATVAMAAGGTMEGMATSTGFQGTTDFYYSNEWLVRAVQFAISWLCIISLIVYYLGWLCSMLVLSNKELFWLIDSLKKEAQNGGGSDAKGFGAVTAVISSFKSGGKDGVNGGLDNILIFALALSINFKAYSFYKDVEAGSDKESSGNKFNYNDTMLNFLLKTLIPSIVITFVTSIAISGTLLGMWFTVGDVMIVRAERFSQTNLSAKIDSLIGDSAGYKFSMAVTGTEGGKIGNEIATKIYAQVASLFPNASADQLQSLGKVIEDRVVKDYLGGSPGGNYYKALEDKVKASQGTANKDSIKITNEQQAALVGVAPVITNVDTSTYNDVFTVYKISDILKAAKLNPDGTNVRYQDNLNVRIRLTYDYGAAGALVSKKQ